MPTILRRDDAVTIWKAGVDAVDSARLVGNVFQVDDESITIAGERWQPAESSRICVVGAGKAGAGMAVGVESSLSSDWLARTTGWVNVPADCVRELSTIRLHAARPAGVNEPTEEGVAGTQEILRQITGLKSDDLCLVLISGGGSALLPAPAEGISLSEKQQVTRTLMHSGATIEELNAVRRSLSKVKGGGLLRSCRAGRLISLIISDVIGDPLETIASGPTVDIQPDPQRAIEVLTQFGRERFPSSVFDVLQHLSGHAEREMASVTSTYSNHVIGNNRTAVDAAAKKAVELGYEVVSSEADQAGDAATFGKTLAERSLEIQRQMSPGKHACLISGGEPTVKLAQTDQPQKGGRNQELVLAAAKYLEENNSSGLTLLSGGTDGEDGPTDAAGAITDSEFLESARQKNLTIDPFLSVNNSYRYFEAIDGLIKTGPTHTNVMDLRVVLIES